MTIRYILAVLSVAAVGYIATSLALFVGLVRLLSRQVHPEEN